MLEIIADDMSEQNIIQWTELFSAFLLLFCEIILIKFVCLHVCL